MTTLSADLDIIITDNKINVVPGIGDTYNIVVTNFGPDTVSGVSLSVPLPSNAINATWTAVSANASGTPAHASGSGSIAETVDDLLAGGSVTYFLSLEADPSAIGHLTITATTSAKVAALITKPSAAPRLASTRPP